MNRTSTPDKVFFSEKQHFTQWWFWLLLAAINGLFLYGTFKQVIAGGVFGNRPLPDAGLIAVTAFVLLLTVLFAIVRLETLYAQDGVYVRFYPYQQTFRQYHWEKTTRAAIRKYSPVLEYGGWGYRLFGNKRAYNMSGDMGLQLEFTDKTQLLIGTGQPEALAEALKKAGKYKP